MKKQIIGLKLTHDAAVAAVTVGPGNEAKLDFSIEFEKINNMPRYTAAPSIEFALGALFKMEGVDVNDAHDVNIDGWRRPVLGLDVCAYEDEACPTRRVVTALPDICFATSTPHITNHITSAYTTAPFAGEDAYVLVWDGGICPRLYEVSDGGIKFVSELMRFSGCMYGIMGYYAGPFKDAAVINTPYDKLDFATLLGGRDKPGKLMSWIGHGFPNQIVMDACMRAYKSLPPGKRMRGMDEHQFVRAVIAECTMDTEADILATIHAFLGQELLMSLEMAMPKGKRLVFCGGCALNIKWNSMLRYSGHFSELWIPPFPNDAGSAIGAAATSAWRLGVRKIAWDVYSGPQLPDVKAVPSGWVDRGVWTTDQLAAWMVENQSEVVAFMQGRAEIGPRALGHRSLFMLPQFSATKAILNAAKGREAWRPVAPIVLESDAPQLFFPGTRDKYMLFDHVLREGVAEKFPAIAHIDGTARVQTVSVDAGGCVVVAALLRAIKKHTGVGMLCNTSANLNGSGFFPDGESAMHWGKAALVWVNGRVFIRADRSA